MSDGRREDRLVKLTERLTVENGAKKLLIGEFREEIEVVCPMCIDDDEEAIDCFVCNGAGRLMQSVPVSWTTIKDIYRRIVEHFTDEQDND